LDIGKYLLKMFKNVVIISVDSLRADGINFNRDLIYGKGCHTLIKTPNLDKFAESGTTFERAYSTSTYTTSAHASLFTGEYPNKHGIRSFFDFNQTLNPNLKTIADELNEHSFKTFFYSDIKELFSEMNIWKGFNIKTYGNMGWLWNSIEEFKNDRNFIFIHTFDVHEPYLYIEDKSIERKINQDYYTLIKNLRKTLKINSKYNIEKNPHYSWEEIRIKAQKENLNEFELLKTYYDKGIEKFDKERFPEIINKLNGLGLNFNNSLFIIIGDHGEGKINFNNRFKFGHGLDLSEDVIRIPILISAKIKKTNLLSIKHIKNIIYNSLFDKNIFNKHKNIDHIYSEVFLNKNSAKLNDSKQHINSDFIKEQESLLYQRGLVLPNSTKIILKGEPEFFSNGTTELPNDVFLKKLYRSLFFRFEDKPGYNHHLKQLDNNGINKDSLKKLFIESKEFKSKKLLTVYNTNNLNDIELSVSNCHKKFVKKLLIRKTNKVVDQILFDNISDLNYESKHAMSKIRMISYSQNFEDVVLERIFSNEFNGFYIDIGAADPVINSVTKHFYDKGWNGINIEPNTLFFNKLKEERPRDISISVGVGIKRKKMTFYLCNKIAEWSTFSKKSMRIHLKHNFKFTKEIKKVLPLNEILENYVDKTIHFLKIDVEGLENEVILSNDWKKFRPFVILVESNNSSSWENHLKKIGYIFALNDGLNNFYVRSDRTDLLKKLQIPANCLDNFEIYKYDKIIKELQNKIKEKEDEIINLNNNIPPPKSKLISDISYLNQQTLIQSEKIKKIKNLKFYKIWESYNRTRIFIQSFFSKNNK